MKMDPRQAQAVETTGSDILVSASAGAGKTRVLVERLVTLCADRHIGMDEILAVTFTEAAASEMTNRVAARLLERSAAETDPREKEWLAKQLVLLADADITTIDSFCLNLIRKYCSVIGLDPATAVSILDESKAIALKEEAFQQALNECDSVGHEGLLALLEAYSPRSEDYETLKTMVFSLKDLIDRSGQPIEVLSQAALSFQNADRFDAIPEVIRDGFFRRIDLYWDTIRLYFDRMLELADTNPSAFKKPENLQEAYNLFLSTEPSLRARDYSGFRMLFEQFGLEQKTASTSKIPGFNQARDAMYDACKKLAEILYSPETLCSDLQDLAPLCGTLSLLTELTMRHFQEKKLELACMDFTDMEQYAQMILTRNDGEVAKLYRSRLKEVMVDEFQDTSYLQNEIIAGVAAPGTIFRVGDVKQSIYRFRGAKPALMRSLGEDPAIRKITLDHNYRSSSKIIEFSNILFQRLMNISGGEDVYGTDDIVSPGVPSQTDPDSDPIRLVLLEDPDTEEEEGEESFSAKERKAGWIASKMIELHEQGYHWNDCSVLVRSHAEKLTLARIFEHCGIPYDIDTRQGFYNSDLCLYLLALMNCLSDPGDDLSLLCVLSGELFSLSDEQLAELKLNYGSVRKGVENTMPEVREWFASLRKLSLQGITAVLDEVALYHGFYEKLSAAGKANFDFLYEKTVNFRSERFTLQDMIRLMTAGSEENSSNASCRSKDDDVVTVTTIHQSKGLQYRVVFLWSSGQNRLMDSNSILLSDNDIPFGLKHISMPARSSRSSIARIAAEYRQNIADIAEYIRVLYVALTRAEQTMYIVDLAKYEQPYQPEITLTELSRRKGITGYITAALKPIPGLYEVLRVPPFDIATIPAAVPAYADALPHFNHPVTVLPPVARPSETEFRSLPPLAPGSAGRGSRYGTLMHSVMEELPNRLWTEEDLAGFQLRQFDIDAIMAFGRSQLYADALAMEIKKELPFYAEDPITHQAVLGTIDFIAFSDERILLIDFKTDALTPEAIRRHYSPQLNSYRNAVRLLKPDTPIEVYAWSFHNNVAIEIPEEDKEN